MRKKIKKELLDLCQGICNTENILKTIVEPNEKINVLEMCQNAVIALGNVLEKHGNLEIIPLLEEYCENIYQESISMEMGEDLTKYTVSRQSMMKQIKQTISEVACELEVVFFPYKASMWDCMESVWEGFSQQKNCSVHVVPIPYYEFDRVDKQAKLCYEGNLFPDYVPIESYEQYHLHEMQPDFAFIHNPYDNCNWVTSVAPEYYSVNLKKYVNKLVYIPYYITGGTEPDSHGKLPVYENMDYIIIQSKSMIDRYVELGIAREKILALGSPKLDAVRRAMEKDRTPNEWKEKIAGRPVYFLNTSITGMLEKDIRALEKAEEIIDIFRKREDCVLLWRPHPLLMSTIRAMRPALQQKFENLKTVSAEPNIIVDETADVSRAVAISKAYIGEETSSMVHLFGAMGKPVFLLDVKMSVTTQADFPIAATGMILQDDVAWFVHCQLPILCKMSLKDGATEIIIRIEGEDGSRLYKGVSKIDDGVLFFVPQWAKEELIYHIDDGKAIKREICGSERIDGTKFFYSKKIENKIWMIPTQYPGLVSYDIDAEKYTVYNSFLKKYSGENMNYFSDYTCVNNEQLYMSCLGSNKVVRFDLETKKAHTYEIGNSDNVYAAIDFDGERLWFFAGNKKSVVIRNINNLEKDEISVCLDVLEQEEDFLKTVVLKKYVYLFPGNYPFVLKIDLYSYRIEKAFLFEDDKNNSLRKDEKTAWPYNFYLVEKLSDTEFIAMRAYDSKIVIYNEENDEKVYIEPHVNKCPCLLRFDKVGENLPYATKESVLNHLNDFLCLAMDSVFKKEDAVYNYQNVVENITDNMGLKSCKDLLEKV